MGKKLPFILIVFFVIFSFGRIYLSEYYVESSPSNNRKFNVVMGQLSNYLNPSEENSLKTDFSLMMRAYLDASRQMQINNGKADKTAGEANPAIVNESITDEILGESAEKENTKSIFIEYPSYKNRATSLNKKLNKYTEKYLIKTPEISENSESKAEDISTKDYSNYQHIGVVNEFGEDEKLAQQKLVENLKNELKEEDYTKLTELVNQMNTEKLYSDENHIIKIYTLLSEFDNLPVEMIVDQLRGYYRVIGYYEPVHATPVAKSLYPFILDQDVMSSRLVEYSNLVSLELKLLDGIHDDYYKGFFIFSAKDKNFLSTVTDFQLTKNGYLGINYEVFKDGVDTDFEKERFYRAIVGELSKIIIEGRDQIDYLNSTPISMGNIGSIMNASKKDSYISLFYSRFWDDILYMDSLITKESSESNARKYFYLRHEDEFLNEYASINPFEDIRQSLTVFFLDEKNLDVTKKYQKARFFYEFEETVRLREKIDENIRKLEAL